MPASDNSIAAAAEVGLDLTEHISSELSAGLLQEVAQIYALSSSHLEMLRATVPQIPSELLDPTGADIPDPFGADLAEYRGTRDAIAACLDRRMPEILALIG